MAEPGLSSVAYDSGSSSTFLMGTSVVPVMTLDPPEVNIKTDKPRSTGSSIALKETPGVAEVSNGKAQIELGYYKDIVLKRMPIHGGTLVYFVGTLNVKHPSITGSYGQLYDRCRIVKRTGPKIASDEKTLVMEIEFSCLNVWEKGDDGTYKCLNYDSAKPSSQAKAAMTF